MMVSDTQKPYRSYMKHHYKKIILLFLVFLLIAVTYDTIAVDKTKDTKWNVSGIIEYHGSSPSQPASIAMVLDSGKIIDKVEADENGVFLFTIDEDLDDKVSFLVWVDGETYRAEDENGLTIYIDLSQQSDQYLYIFIDHSVHSPKKDDVTNDDSEGSDIFQDDGDDPIGEPDSSTDDSSDSSNSSENPGSDDTDESDEHSSDDSQQDHDDTDDNTSVDSGQSDNSTSGDQNNTSNDSTQNTTDPSQDTRITHNISFNKTIWIEETQTWARQHSLEIHEEVLYHISIKNNDTGNLTNITIIDHLPDGLIFNNSNSTNNNTIFQQVYDPVNHTISWNITMLEANQTIRIDYQCITNSSGLLTNMVTLNASGNGGLWYEKNSSTDLFVFGHVFVEKHVWDPQLMTWTNHLITKQDSHLRMNITIVYHGGFILQNISCVDMLSEDMEFLGNETINGISSTFSYNETQHQFIWNTSYLNPDEPVYLEFDVKVKNQSTHVNTVIVTSMESIGKTFTNTSMVTVESVSEDQVYINKTVGYSLDLLDESLNATINDTIFFSVDIRNIGNATLFNMTLKDHLPSSMSYVKNSATFIFQNTSFHANPTIDENTNMLIWSRVQTIIEDHIGPYEHCYLSYKVKLLSLGSCINTVNFSYGRYDGETTVNSSSHDNASVLVTDQIRPLTVSITTPDEIFVDTLTNFQATVSGGQSPYTFFWDFDDGSNSTEPSPVHIYMTPGLYTISLKVIDSNNTTVTTSQYITVHVKDIDPPLINLSVPSRSIYVKGREIIPFFATLIFGKIEISGMVTDNESTVELIQIYIDNSEVASFDQSLFTWSWEDRVFGRHEIKIVALDSMGNMNMVKTLVWKFF